MKNTYTIKRFKAFNLGRTFFLSLLMLAISGVAGAQASQDFSATPTGTNNYVDMGSGASQHILVNNMAPQTAPNAVTDGTSLGYQVTFTPTRMPSIGLSDGEIFGAIDVTTPVDLDNDLAAVGIDFVAQAPTGGNNNVYFLQDPDGLTTIRFNPVVVNINTMFSMEYIIRATTYENSQGADDRLEIYLVNMAGGARVDLLTAINEQMENNETWQTLTADLSAMAGQTMQLVVEFDTNAASEEAAINNISFSTGIVMPDWPVCVEPAAPVVAQVPASVCPGNPFRLTFSGNLNNATQWVIYDDAMGMNRVAATTGSSYDFFDGAAPGTTYYVRGEGECAAAGDLVAFTLTSSAPGDCMQDDTPGTSFEEPLGSSENYADTQNPRRQHTLMNNQGEPAVLHNFNAAELGFTIEFIPTRSGASGDAGLSDGDAIGVSNNSELAFTDGDQGLVLEDTDGTVVVFMSPVDLTGLTDVTVSFDYFVNSTTYEESDTGTDAFAAGIARGFTPLEQIVSTAGDGSTGLPGLETGVWTTLTYTITGNYTEPVQLIFQADLDAGTERVLIDNISFSAGTIVCQDTDAPVVTCPDPVMINADDNCSGIATFAATATDDCSSNVTITYTQNSGTAFQNGQTAVTATATDESGKNSMCTFNVTVTDVTAPTVACPDPVSVDADDSCMGVANFAASATDNCTTAVGFAYSQASGTSFPVGVTTVMVTATDDSGLSDMCSFNVTVNDVTAPVITCTDITVQLDANNCTFTFTDASFDPVATDNCGTVSILSENARTPNLVSTLNGLEVGISSDGFGIIWVATDEAGLTDTCTSVLTLINPPSCFPTSVNSQDASAFSAIKATPNPFTAGTTISFELPVITQVGVEILDIAGRVLATDVINPTGNNTYSWYWDTQQATLPAGMYFARLRAEGSVYTQRLILMK